MAEQQRVRVVAVIDVPPAAVAVFQQYEQEVLPLLEQHGGVLERRLRTADGTTEVHVLSFATDVDYRSYRQDPRRQAARGLLDGVEVRQRAVEHLVEVG